MKAEITHFVMVLQLVFSGVVVMLAVLLEPCAASCALEASDWQAIKAAYLERNTYEPLRDRCNATFASSFHSKYGNCAQTLGEVLADRNLEQNCVQYFQSTLYDGKSSNTALLASTLCTTSTFGEVIKSNICNALTVVGCPTTRSLPQFAVFASCNGAYLRTKTEAEQLAYYASGADVACMVRMKVCVDMKMLNWESCPLIISDVFEYIDTSKSVYTCDTIFPSAQARCRERFDDILLRYCPLPTELEKNMPVIIVCSIIALAIVVIAVCTVRRHRRRTHLHHVSRREIMQHAITNFVSDQPARMLHPELQTVLAESKFSGVIFDPKTQQWGVLGDSQRYATEKEAAQRAYLNLAKKQQQQRQKQQARRSSGSGLKKSPANTAAAAKADVTQSTREFLEIIKPSSSAASKPDGSASSANRSNDGDAEYVVRATPLTPQQTVELRYEQLVAFYQFWEPERADIEGHSKALLEKHSFDHLVRALKTKYGVCPPSWDSFDDV